MSLTSDEVNFLVYRYLLESGFVHSAFSFAHESFAARSAIDAKQVPPGALISFIQKGLQFVEIEQHIKDDGTEVLCDEPFNVLTPHTCSVQSHQRIFDPYEPLEADYGDIEIDLDELVRLKGHKSMISATSTNTTANILATGSSDGTIIIWDISSKSNDDDDDDNLDNIEKSRYICKNAVYVQRPQDKNSNNDNNDRTTPPSSTSNKRQREESSADHDSQATKKSKTLSGKSKTTKDTSHSNRRQDDTTDKSETEQDGKQGDMTAAQKVKQKPSTDSIVAMAWNNKGTRLAAASYDGELYIYSRDGTIQKRLHYHTGPITQLQFNTRGNYLLSAGVDGHVIVWDVTGSSRDAQIAYHVMLSVPALDAQWRDSVSFATADMSGEIRLCNIGQDEPINQFQAHDSEISSIRWDSKGKMLISSSSDCSVKLWSADDMGSGKSKKTEPALTLGSHDRAVTCAEWACKNSALIATASIDTTVRIWDTTSGECLHKLAQHMHPVTSLSFSASGEYLATGSHDRLHVWNVETGILTKTFKSSTEGGINELRWVNSDTIAVGAANADVVLFKLRVE